MRRALTGAARLLDREAASMDALARVVDLKRHGRFAEAFRLLDAGGASNHAAASLERLELFERLGQYARCRTLAEDLLKSRHLTVDQRGVCEYVLS